LFLVQCKHWRARQVGVSVVRELCGVVSAERAAGGFVVTSGSFTEEARAFAERTTVSLLDGNTLGARADGAAANTMASLSGDPRCPRCSSGMTRRVAHRGERAGRDFWGCSQFPRCRGTRSIG
jgi:restriction system protein